MEGGTGAPTWVARDHASSLLREGCSGLLSGMTGFALFVHLPVPCPDDGRPAAGRHDRPASPRELWLDQGYSREIRVLDRIGLEARSDAAYGIPEAEHCRLIGPVWQHRPRRRQLQILSCLRPGRRFEGIAVTRSRQGAATASSFAVVSITSASLGRRRRHEGAIALPRRAAKASGCPSRVSFTGSRAPVGRVVVWLRPKHHIGN
jgi:hypothetical protein